MPGSPAYLQKSIELFVLPSSNAARRSYGAVLLGMCDGRWLTQKPRAALLWAIERYFAATPLLHFANGGMFTEWETGA